MKQKCSQIRQDHFLSFHMNLIMHVLFIAVGAILYFSNLAQHRIHVILYWINMVPMRSAGICMPLEVQASRVGSRLSW